MNPLNEWVRQRHYPDLDPRAERAIRKAGLSFSRDTAAEAHLQVAAKIAPEHEAVLVAQYRYYLYKHRFAEAAGYARAAVACVAGRLGIDADPLRIESGDLPEGVVEAELRAWLLACQAYGYVLLRAGYQKAGMAMLEHLAEVDVADHTRTGALLEVIRRAGTALGDDDEPDCAE